jgi:hypothetical protein
MEMQTAAGITTPPHSRGAPKEWDITQDVVRELLDYNPDTGRLTWKVRDRKWFPRDSDWKRWNTCFAGKSLGAKSTGSSRTFYLSGRIRMFRRTFSAHRLIYLWMTGSFPHQEIDHINGDGMDIAGAICERSPIR